MHRSRPGPPSVGQQRARGVPGVTRVFSCAWRWSCRPASRVSQKPNGCAELYSQLASRRAQLSARKQHTPTSHIQSNKHQTLSTVDIPTALPRGGCNSTARAVLLSLPWLPEEGRRCVLHRRREQRRRTHAGRKCMHAIEREHCYQREQYCRRCRPTSRHIRCAFVCGIPPARVCVCRNRPGLCTPPSQFELPAPSSELQTPLATHTAAVAAASATVP